MPLTDIDGQRLGDSCADKLGNRNLVINGAMNVAQRSTSVTGVTADGYYTVDRFQLAINNLGTYTVTQESDGPDGFSNSFKIDCTTADSSPAAADFLIFFQFIEAQYLQSLSYGTSGAQAITISYYVKSNKTGNASFVMQQKDNSDKQVSFQYTINSANTWEKKTHTIPGDTSGVINDDNGAGLSLEWWLNSGSNFTGGSHRSTWTAEDNTDRNASNLGIGGSTNDFWQITGVQLEIGNTATPFEHRSFGDELLRCQRYLYRVNRDPASGDEMAFGTGGINTSSLAQCYATLPVTMRANSQAITESDLSVISGPNVTDVSLSSTLDEGNNCVGINVTADSGTPFTVGRAALIRVKNTSGAFFQVDSEL